MSFDCSKDLSAHYLSHNQEPPYSPPYFQCEGCELLFNRFDDLFTHKNIHILDEFKELQSTQMLSNENLKTFVKNVPTNGAHITYNQLNIQVTNTCAIDNLLFSLYYLSLINPNFLRNLVFPQTQDNVKEKINILVPLLNEIISLIAQNDWDLAKQKWILDVMKLKPNKKLLTLYSSEDESFVDFLRPLQKHQIIQKCTQSCIHNEKFILNNDADLLFFVETNGAVRIENNWIGKCPQCKTLIDNKYVFKGNPSFIFIECHPNRESGIRYNELPNIVSINEKNYCLLGATFLKETHHYVSILKINGENYFLNASSGQFLIMPTFNRYIMEIRNLDAISNIYKLFVSTSIYYLSDDQSEPAIQKIPPATSPPRPPHSSRETNTVPAPPPTLQQLQPNRPLSTLTQPKATKNLVQPRFFPTLSKSSHKMPYQIPILISSPQSQRRNPDFVFQNYPLSLLNDDNSCYANVILQCLLHLGPPFIYSVINEPDTTFQDTKSFKFHFIKYLKLMINREKSCFIRSRWLREIVRPQNGSLDSYVNDFQQDAFLFLTDLLNGLSPNTCKLFQFSSHQKRTCSNCKNTMVLNELNIKSTKLALNTHSNTTDINDAFTRNEEGKCNQCQVTCNQHYKLEFSFPEDNKYVILDTDLFEWNRDDRRPSKKINSLFVNYNPNNINLPQIHGESLKKFRILAIVIRYGELSLESGHYVVTTRNLNGDGWININDKSTPMFKYYDNLDYIENIRIWFLEKLDN